MCSTDLQADRQPRVREPATHIASASYPSNSGAVLSIVGTTITIHVRRSHRRRVDKKEALTLALTSSYAASYWRCRRATAIPGGHPRGPAPAEARVTRARA